MVGGVATIIGLYEFYKKFLVWSTKRREFKREVALLKSSDYFIAHIIHLGGEFSMTYSLQVYSDEEGGYYFNPPKDFVSVSFNRGGDCTVVMPTELSKKYGFAIHFMADSSKKYFKTPHRDICHLAQNSLKNEHFVKFVKIMN